MRHGRAHAPHALVAALLMGSAAVAFAAAPTTKNVSAPAAPTGTSPSGLAATTRNDCPVPSDAFLRAKLAGSVNRALEWRAGQMECEGMRRPDGRGLRVTFRGRIGDDAFTFVFGAPGLAEGKSARAMPVNVTIIREGHGVYGTRGEDKCTLDDVRQIALAPTSRARRWRIEARGFCLEPARAVGGRPNDAILASTFDFAGYLTWDID